MGRCFFMTRRAQNDRDLLLGMLALECGLVDHAQLLRAFRVWNAGADRSMAEILVEQGALDESAIAIVSRQLDQGDRSKDEKMGADRPEGSEYRAVARGGEPGAAATVAHSRAGVSAENRDQAEAGPGAVGIHHD